MIIHVNYSRNYLDILSFFTLNIKTNALCGEKVLIDEPCTQLGSLDLDHFLQGKQCTYGAFLLRLSVKES